MKCPKCGCTAYRHGPLWKCECSSSTCGVLFTEWQQAEIERLKGVVTEQTNRANSNATSLNEANLKITRLRARLRRIGELEQLAKTPNGWYIANQAAAIARGEDDR